MSGIIPGYEYDIFISYRQKDNKGDRWVSEFVDALKSELDSTFKEEIKVYFDNNPVDGILETYNVDASLKDKLKCLIFIPVISQTYCDPNSYAWQHEFREFNRISKEDQFGRDIRLDNGNVASRILPVRIHDLDAEDKTILENELGGVLRSVDFIFKSPGVNRPLKPDDSRTENLNRTFYRDQINKVANTVKEIIKGLKRINSQKEISLPGETFASQVHTLKKENAIKTNKSFLVLILAIFLAGGYFTISSIIKSDSKPGDKSIAVLPFENLSDDPENEYFSRGVTEAINRYLLQIGELRVVSLTAANPYTDNSRSPKEISKELAVSNLLRGSIQRFENQVRIEMQLIDATSEHQLWAENYDREINDIFRIQSEIAEKVALALKTTLTLEERATLNEKTTTDIRAYDLYMKGEYELNTYTRTGLHNALEYFKQVIELDPGYALAYVGIATCYIDMASIFGSELNTPEAAALAIPYLNKALELNPALPEAHAMKGFILLYNNWDFAGAESEYRRSIITNNKSALSLYADFLNFVNRHDEALTIARRLDQSDPFYPNTRIIFSLYYLGRYEEAIQFSENRLKVFKNYSTLEGHGFLMLNTGMYNEAIDSFLNTFGIENIRYPRGLGWMGAAYAHLGQREKAMELIKELKTQLETSRAGSVGFYIAVIYSALGDKESALYWLNEAYIHHEMEIPWLRSEPQFYSLHNDPRFQDLLRKVGFP
jgi:TolB-like protein